MKQKIIVLGSTGMLGSVVSKYLALKDYNVKALTRKELDIESQNAVYELKDMVEKDTAYIINCAGAIKPRISNMCTEEETLAINSAFPIKIAGMIRALSTRNYPVRFIHISTDCVFTGDTAGKYQVEDIPDSEDMYGLSKFLGEACKVAALVIRTSIIGEEIRNKYSLLEWMKSMKGEHVHGWTDHIWSGVTTLQLAKFIEKTIDQDTFHTGLIQYAGKPINKYELLKAINRIYNLDIDVHEDEEGALCDRSLELDVFATDEKVPSIITQLIELKKFFEVNIHGNV